MTAWSALGNHAWDANGMAPCYKKFQRFDPASDATKEVLATKYKNEVPVGTEGPLSVTYPDVYGPFTGAWMEILEKLGWGNTNDPMSGDKIGAFHTGIAVHPKTKTRGYPATAYYNEVSKRPNLQVLLETHVEKVLFRKEAGSPVVATGVLARTKDGEIHEIAAKKEVILAAGALQPPQILELSGVGQRELLERHNIPVVMDSPGVG